MNERGTRTSSSRVGINAELAAIKTRMGLREYLGRWRIQRRGEGWGEGRIDDGYAWIVRRWYSIRTP